MNRLYRYFHLIQSLHLRLETLHFDRKDNLSVFPFDNILHTPVVSRKHIDCLNNSCVTQFTNSVGDFIIIREKDLSHMYRRY